MINNNMMFYVGQILTSNRGRSDHLYASLANYMVGSGTSSQTAMECEPLPPIGQSRHQGRSSLYHPTQARVSNRGSINTMNSINSSNYAPCSLPAEPMVCFYQTYEPQHHSFSGIVGPPESTGAKLPPSNTKAERDDSPMIGVCVQQSPVAIH